MQTLTNTPSTETKLTQADVAVLVLRLVLGVIFFAHGAQKVFGWYGGPGLAATVQGMGGMGIPAPLALLAAFTELLGGLGVLVGLLTRLAALGLAVTMSVAVLKVHLSGGLFAANNGFEFPLALLAISLALVAYGAGRWSLDAVLAKALGRSARPSADRPVTA